MPLNPPLIEIKGLQKSFGNVQALRGLDFRLNKGEIVGLLGDNGAGKSTFIKTLSGLHRPEAGEFYFEGQPVDFSRYTVSKARKMGLETVYQDKALADQQPLWRNLFVGRHLKTSWGLIDVKKEKAVAQSLIESLGLTGAGLSPDSPAGILSGGERQGLAIARAMHFAAKVLILDEPTTALALSEVDRVLEFVARFKNKGGSAIFISHSLDHAWEVADRFVLMAKGRIFGQWARADLSLDGLIEKMREALR